ncbi:MAG: septal ring lytic transglycosylase RlpA family protein [Gammaproteobacteria bacterium]|nr:septal ring lytic transglycosylase RlpA family protein [Gammaproteobacteria bacterium]
MYKQLNLTTFLKYISYFILASTILINGCSSMHRKDGPPSFNVDETKIPDAVPKKEARAKYGNMPFYHVFGKRYDVMPKCVRYEERGIASWYGTKFNSQRTSSGERYNMLAMTAAHKTLPLPTYVEVTNLKNGRKVVVKVNDRGPFESNRLIDLSYVAAKKLGMLGHGTAPVNVKAIDIDGEAKHPYLFAKNTARSSSNASHCIIIPKGSGLYLQVGSFKNKSFAEKLQKKLIAQVHSPVFVGWSKNLYKVQVGPIKDVTTQNRIVQQLKSLGLASARIHNLNDQNDFELT